MKRSQPAYLKLAKLSPEIAQDSDPRRDKYLDQVRLIADFMLGKTGEIRSFLSRFQPEELPPGGEKIMVEEEIRGPRLVDENFNPEKKTEIVERVRTPEWAYNFGFEMAYKNLDATISKINKLKEIAEEAADGVHESRKKDFMQDIYRESDRLFRAIGWARLWIACSKPELKNVPGLRIVTDIEPDEQDYRDPDVVRDVINKMAGEIDVQRRRFVLTALSRAGISQDEWMNFVGEQPLNV